MGLPRAVRTALVRGTAVTGATVFVCAVAAAGVVLLSQAPDMSRTSASESAEPVTSRSLDAAVAVLDQETDSFAVELFRVTGPGAVAESDLASAASNVTESLRASGVDAEVTGELAPMTGSGATLRLVASSGACAEVSLARDSSGMFLPQQPAAPCAGEVTQVGAG